MQSKTSLHWSRESIIMQAAFTSLLLDWVKIWDSGMIAVFTISLSRQPVWSRVHFPSPVPCPISSILRFLPAPSPPSVFGFSSGRGVCVDTEWFFPYVVAFSLLSFSSTSSQFMRMTDSQICFLPIYSSLNLLVDNVYIFSLLRINEALADTNSECFSDEILPINMSVSLFLCP